MNRLFVCLLAVLWLAPETVPAEVQLPPVTSNPLLTFGTQNQVVAIVNDEVITLTEILRTMPGKKPDLVTDQEWLQFRLQQFQERLNTVKERKLLFQEAKLAKIEIPADQVDAEVDQRWQRLFESKDKFLAYLKRLNMPLRQYRQEVMEDMMARALIRRRVEMILTISPKELFGFYGEHPDEFSVDEARELYLIQIPANLESGEDSAVLAASIVKRSREKPEEFEKLAKKYSVGPSAAEGGYWGWKKPADMRKDLAFAAFKLKAGEISEVITATDGYFIFKVVNVRPGKVEPFEGAQTSIRRRLQNQRFVEDRQKLLDELLKRAYVVEFLPDPVLLQ